MPTEKPKYELVAHTGWSRGGSPEYPARFVVLKWLNKDPKYGQYSVQMQVNDGKSKSYFISGHHDLHYTEALKVMKKKLDINNKDFPKGNISNMNPTITIVGS
jgi:hypothetical protein